MINEDFLVFTCMNTVLDMTNAKITPPKLYRKLCSCKLPTEQILLRACILLYTGEVLEFLAKVDKSCIGQ